MSVIQANNTFLQVAPCRIVSTSNIPGNYYNGFIGNGIGSTITSTSGIPLIIDDVTILFNDRVLLQNQSNSYENGIYILVSLSVNGSNWILQRSGDFQSVEQMKGGKFIPIYAGTDGAGSIYVQIEPIPLVIGISPITFQSIFQSSSITSDAKSGVVAATTANLNAVYFNGSSGIGASLTQLSSFSPLVIDGVSLGVGDRVIVNNQISSAQNGIYYLYQNGDNSSIHWVLVRSSDYDNSSDGLIGIGDYTAVAKGSINGGYVFVQTNYGPFTVGSSPINFIKISALTLNANQSIAAGTGSSVGSANNSFAFGISAQATGNYSFSFGQGTTSNALYSFSYGTSFATGTGAWSIGNLCSVSGGYSLGFGESCSVTADNAVAIGDNCVTSDIYSLSFGNSCVVASGANYSIAFGNSCHANAPNSYAIGSASFANGQFSWALGLNSQTNNAGSVVWGDSNGGATRDNAANQFRLTFAGGYFFHNGSVNVSTVGFGLVIAEGPNAKQGTATLVGGTVVVNNTSVKTLSRIFLTAQESGVLAGNLRISARTAGTSFTILSTNSGDTATVAYEIFDQ